MSSVKTAGLRRAGFIALTVSLGLVASGCGSGKTTTTTNAAGQTTVSCSIHFAKTKFVLHAGIAAGAFYRYIYNRAGTFKKNAPGRKKALVKAAATSLLVVHELKIAARDAQCDGPALKKLASPIRGLLDATGSLKAIETGSGLGAIATAATAFDKLKTASAGAGAVIKQK